MVKEKSFFIKDPCSNLELTESQYIEFREEIFRGEPNERIENVISDILPRGSSPEISIKKEDACIECKCKRRIFTWEYCWECGKKFIVDFTIISYWKKITNFFTENNVANDSCLDEVDFIFSGKKQKLKNVTINNFTLSKTKFSKILFDNCKFLSCKFDSSVFSKVVFRNCSFKNCVFARNRIDKSKFFDCTFLDCSFLNTQFSRSNLYNTTLEYVAIIGSNFHSCKFPRSTFSNCDISFTNLENTSISKSSMSGFSLIRSFISENTKIERCQFNNTKFFATIFKNTLLKKTNFDKRCTLTKTEFDNAFLENVGFNEISINEVRFGKGTKINNCDFSNSELNEVFIDGKFVKLNNANFQSAIIKGCVLSFCDLTSTNMFDVNIDQSTKLDNILINEVQFYQIKDIIKSSYNQYGQHEITGSLHRQMIKQSIGRLNLFKLGMSCASIGGISSLLLCYITKVDQNESFFNYFILYTFLCFLVLFIPSILGIKLQKRHSQQLLTRRLLLG